MLKTITILTLGVSLISLLTTPVQSVSLCDAYICNKANTNDFTNDSSIQFCATGLNVNRSNQDQTFDTYMLKSSQSCKNTGENVHNYCNYDVITEPFEATLCYNKTLTGSTAQRAPGEACTMNDQCYGEKLCQNGVCLGVGDGGDCTGNLDCPVGLYCKSNKCTPQLAVGATCASDDYCVNNAKCNNRACVAFFSLDKGADVTNQDPRMCKSGYIEDNLCADGLKLKNRGRVGEKAESLACSYLNPDGTESLTKQMSKCGYGMIPSAYCSLGAGDAEFIKVLGQAKQLVDNPDLSKCHIQNAFGCTQLMTSGNMLSLNSFTNIMTLRDNYIQTQDAPDCINWNLNFDLLYVMQGAYPTAPKDLVQSNIVLDDSLVEMEKVIE